MDDKLEALKEFCDRRAHHGKILGVRDPKDKHGRKNHFINILLRDALIEQIQKHQIQSLLDVGCGSAVLTQEFNRYVPTTLGMDISLHMLRHADTNHPNMHLFQYDGVTFPLKNQSIGAVLSCEVFHLLPDDMLMRLLSECYRTLRTGGLVINVCINSHNKHRQNISNARFERAPSDFLRLTEKTGFESLYWFPIRRCRSLVQYLVRYLPFTISSIEKLACAELAKMRKRRDYRTNYCADYLFVSKKCS